MKRDRGDWGGGLGVGLILIVLGVTFLLERMGYVDHSIWHRWWPAVVIAFGLAKLVRPRHAEHLGSGVTTTLIGCWLLAANEGWYGLTWMNSWPLALVAGGTGMVVRAIATRYMPDERKEEPRG